MRFRRSILASLGPLLSLSALMAAMAAAPNSSSDPGQNPNTLVRLLRSVVHTVTADAENASISIAPARASHQSVLDFTALADTPLAHSVWMVETPPAVNLIARRHLRAQLRC